MKKPIIISIIILLAGVAKINAQTIPLDSIPQSFRISLQSMFDDYLKLENALMEGNTVDAGKFALELNTLTGAADISSLQKKQQKTFRKQARKIIVNTRHIKEHDNDYDHECEHFDLLTDEFYSLLRSFHFNSVVIYYNYTADGNGGNSAHWLTDKDSMNDPYFKGKTHMNDKRVAVIPSS